jgi:hypothetical protein
MRLNPAPDNPGGVFLFPGYCIYFERRVIPEDLEEEKFWLYPARANSIDTSARVKTPLMPGPRYSQSASIWRIRHLIGPAAASLTRAMIAGGVFFKVPCFQSFTSTGAPAQH